MGLNPLLDGLLFSFYNEKSKRKQVTTMLDEKYIVVVGGVNMDISGTTADPMRPRDSNPGHVRLSPGGVGRNIAENMCRLGCRVKMITAFGPDANAEAIRRDGEKYGLDFSHSLILPDARTSTYVCLNDPDGEIYAAVSDMDIYERLTPDFLATKLDVLASAALVVVDANLTEETIAWLADNCPAPMAADPVSVAKAGKLLPCLKRLHAIKPNRAEATLLTGVKIMGTLGLDRAAQVLLDAGVKNVFISLGAEGVYYNDGQHSGICPIAPVTVRNTTGSGDAFCAAAAMGCVMGLNIHDIARMGQAAAGLCSESEAAVSPDINMDNLNNLIKQMEA